MPRSRRTPTTMDSPKRGIPEFKSLEEEAAWWDTHDVTDYLDDLSLVTLDFGEHPSPRPVVVPLDSESFTALKAKASERGISITSLAKEWIEERLRSA